MRTLALLIAATLSIGAQERGPDHWVVTWATAEAMARLGPAPSASANPQTPARPGSRFSNQSIRMAAHVSIGGKRLRIKFEDGFGYEPVTIGAAHVALRTSGSDTVTGSDRTLKFNNQPGCTLQPGMVMLSDPVDLDFAPQSDLAVSIYIPGSTGVPTSHGTGLHDTYIQSGDATASGSWADAAKTQSYYYLSAIDVVAPANAGAIVAFGDSITDGSHSSNEGNHSWPALLAARLASSKATANIGVANVGIGGNRVLRDNSGVSALGRLDRDALTQSGVKWLMFLEGINDIGHGDTEPVTADDLIGAYKQIIARAHTAGIEVIGCTLTPYMGANYSRPEGEQIRETVNAWIRQPGHFDAFVDFEAATRDSSTPPKFRPEFDPGDHLHPNDKGYESMANAIDLKIFKK